MVSDYSTAMAIKSRLIDKSHWKDCFRPVCWPPFSGLSFSFDQIGSDEFMADILFMVRETTIT